MDQVAPSGAGEPMTGPRILRCGLIGDAIGRSRFAAGLEMSSALSGLRLGFTPIDAAGRPGRVAMAGAGGVARAIAPALAEPGANEISVWDTDPARARTLAALKPKEEHENA